MRVINVYIHRQIDRETVLGAKKVLEIAMIKNLWFC